MQKCYVKHAVTSWRETGEKLPQTIWSNSAIFALGARKKGSGHTIISIQLTRPELEEQLQILTDLIIKRVTNEYEMPISVVILKKRYLVLAAYRHVVNI